MIEVPYWWDRKPESLAATIRGLRPTLIPNTPIAHPIPIVCPEEESLIPLPISYAHSWDEIVDVTGWYGYSIESFNIKRWMSEKMDGIRGYWNGENLLSRNGNTLDFPEWFVEGFPTHVALDGELWMGQGTSVDDLMRVLNSKNPDWDQIGFYVFDIPSSPGTYEERMQQMEELKPVVPPHVHIVKNTLRAGRQHLYEYLYSITKQKGEGVMIRKPNTSYEKGYTFSLLKVKVFKLPWLLIHFSNWKTQKCEYWK